MAKQQKKAKYERHADGLTPGITDYGAVIRNPVEILVRPNEAMMIDLGISFDQLALIYPRGTLLSYVKDGKAEVRVIADAGDNVVYAKNPVRIWVRSTGDATLRIDVKEAMVDAVLVGGVELSEA